VQISLGIVFQTFSSNPSALNGLSDHRPIHPHPFIIDPDAASTFIEKALEDEAPARAALGVLGSLGGSPSK
jgi:hypothetical protein